MAYATRADIEAIYGARHLETLIAPDADSDVAVNAAIVAAQAMIDPYLRKRYTLPLSVVPEAIRRAAIDIACWQLAPAADRMAEQIEKRMKMHLDFLRDLAAGRAELAELQAVPAAVAGEANSLSGAAFGADARRWGLA